jgi:cytochrome P450
MEAPAPLAEIHPFDPRVLEDPSELNRRLRREAPVYRDPNTGIFLISTYAAVVAALEDHEGFSNRFGQALGAGARTPPEVRDVLAEGYPPVDTMLTADPPEQRRYRKLVNKAFVPRRVNALEPRIESLSNELVDGFAADGRVELLSQYAQLLPLILIAEQLGVPRADLAMFRRWSDGFVAQLGGMADRAGQVEAAKLIVGFQRYFAERLEERRREPRDDILSEIVHAQVEGERPLDVAECLSILQQLLVAGNETTANAIAEGMLLLVRNPGELARVESDPGLVPNLVEEVLRLATPTTNMWRICTRDVELAGARIPKGSFVLLRYASANRDEARFPDPDRFDVRRANAADHLAFGQGIHFCLGAALARKEMEVAFRTLLRRLGDWRLAPGLPAPRHKPNVLLRGLEALHLEFRERAAAP